MKQIKSIIISFLIGAGVAIIMTKSFWPTHKIEIRKIIEYKTQWKTQIEYVNSRPIISEDNFKKLLECLESEINFKDEIKDEYITVTASDACKENKVRYKLKITDFDRHIFQASAMYQYKIGYSTEISYINNLGFMGIGGGVIINKNNPGFKIIIQKGF
jgi:hypothetical protein